MSDINIQLQKDLQTGNVTIYASMPVRTDLSDAKAFAEVLLQIIQLGEDWESVEK